MMRRRTAIVLCAAVWLCASSRAGDDAPAPAPPPVASAPHVARVAWYRRVTKDAFEAAGQKDPKWEADARSCVDAFFRSLDQPGLLRNGDAEDLILLYG